MFLKLAQIMSLMGYTKKKKGGGGGGLIVKELGMIWYTSYLPTGVLKNTNVLMNTFREAMLKIFF